MTLTPLAGATPSASLAASPGNGSDGGGGDAFAALLATPGLAPSGTPQHAGASSPHTGPGSAGGAPAAGEPTTSTTSVEAGSATGSATGAATGTVTRTPAGGSADALAVLSAAQVVAAAQFLPVPPLLVSALRLEMEPAGTAVAATGGVRHGLGGVLDPAGGPQAPVKDTTSVAPATGSGVVPALMTTAPVATATTPAAPDGGPATPDATPADGTPTIPSVSTRTAVPATPQTHAAGAEATTVEASAHTSVQQPAHQPGAPGTTTDATPAGTPAGARDAASPAPVSAPNTGSPAPVSAPDTAPDSTLAGPRARAAGATATATAPAMAPAAPGTAPTAENTSVTGSTAPGESAAAGLTALPPTPAEVDRGTDRATTAPASDVQHAEVAGPTTSGLPGQDGQPSGHGGHPGHSSQPDQNSLTGLRFEGLTGPVAMTGSVSGAAPEASQLASYAVSDQVFGEVTRLVSRGDGTQRITLNLQPEVLGDVRVILTVRGGEVQVRMTGGDLAQQALLHGAPELHRLLDSVGATSSRIVVGDTASTAQQNFSATAQDGQRGADHSFGGSAGGFGDRADQPMHDSHRGAGTRHGDTSARDGSAVGSVRTHLPPDPGTRTPSGVDVTM